MSFDLIIRGGRVVDGIGMPGYTADIGVRTLVPAKREEATLSLERAVWRAAR